MCNSKTGLIQHDRLYQSFLVCAGLVVVFLFRDFEKAIASWQQLSLFFVLLFISTISGVRQCSGNSFSVGFIIELAVIQIFGMQVAVLTTFITLLLVNGMKSILGSSKLSTGLLNTSVGTLTVFIAGLAYHSSSQPIFGFIAASLIYYAVHVTLLTSLNYRYSLKEFSFKDQWVEIGKEISLNYFVLAPLAYLIPYVFNTVNTQNKLFFVLLFFVPVLLVNYAYRLYVNIRQSYLNTVKTMIAAIEAKDPHVIGHAQRVADYALAIARDMGYSDKELTRLQYIALLHDAGKIGVRDYILNKPETLTAEEYEMVKEHSVIGEQIIKKIKFLSSGADIVRYHHERFDGRGYPEGLEGYDIPEGARILAVADSFDVMTTEKPYRKAKTKLAALAELEALAGQQFDPRIVEVFKRIIFRQGEI